MYQLEEYSTNIAHDSDVTIEIECIRCELKVGTVIINWKPGQIDETKRESLIKKFSTIKFFWNEDNETKS